MIATGNCILSSVTIDNEDGEAMFFSPTTFAIKLLASPEHDDKMGTLMNTPCDTELTWRF